MNDFINSHANEIFAFINAVLVSVILPMFGVWLRNHLNEKRASRVEIAIQSGLSAGIAAYTSGKNSQQTLTAVLNDPIVRDNVIAFAKDYVLEVIPKTVKKLGIDPSLDKIVSARVETAVAALADKYLIANKAIAAADENRINNGSQAAV